MPPIVITCEHATFRIPEEYYNLGLSSDMLQHHIVWDPGAIELAEGLAAFFGESVHKGKVSRLICDLNRSLGHPTQIVQENFGIIIPGNVGLTDVQIASRQQRYYIPYRDSVFAEIEGKLSQYPYIIHTSLHSFNEGVDESRKHIDVGIMHVCQDVAAEKVRDGLCLLGWKARINEPYDGKSDGFMQVTIEKFGRERVHAIQFECNARVLSENMKKLQNDIGEVLSSLIAEEFFVER